MIHSVVPIHLPATAVFRVFRVFRGQRFAVSPHDFRVGAVLGLV
jgi:hypothetical protein